MSNKQSVTSYMITDKTKAKLKRLKDLSTLNESQLINLAVMKLKLNSEFLK